MPRPVRDPVSRPLWTSSQGRWPPRWRTRQMDTSRRRISRRMPSDCWQLNEIDIHTQLGIRSFKMLAFKLYVFKTTQARPQKPLDAILGLKRYRKNHIDPPNQSIIHPSIHHTKSGYTYAIASIFGFSPDLSFIWLCLPLATPPYLQCH